MGHAIEALRHCLGYHTADPALEISVVLHAAVPRELAELCPFIERAYGAPYEEPAKAVREIPAGWDFVVDNHRSLETQNDTIPGFRAYWDASRSHFVARRTHGIAGAAPPAYVPHQNLRFDVPATGPRAISVIFVGTSFDRDQYPSVASWKLVLDALHKALPGHVFNLIGRSTTQIREDEVRRIVADVPAKNYFDKPIVEQLSALRTSDLLVAPHTGFAFCASCVDTPWLALSGGRWHEYFFNGVPFHSVLPEERPAFVWTGELNPAVMSDERFERDLPEIVDAALRLVAGEVDYEAALADYFPRLLDAYDGDRSRVFSFDALHERYL